MDIHKNTKNPCLKSNIKFIISLCALLMLFFAPRKSIILLECMILLCALVLSGRMNFSEIRQKYNQYNQLFSYIAASYICATGIEFFYRTWQPSGKVAMLAGFLRLPKLVFLVIMGLMIAAAGAYATLWIAHILVGIFMEANAKEGVSFRFRDCLRSLRKYWHIYVSFVLFLLINLSSNLMNVNSDLLKTALSFFIALPVFFLFSGVWMRWMEEMKHEKFVLKLCSLITAAGISLGIFDQIYTEVILSDGIQALAVSFPFLKSVIIVAFGLCAAAAIWFLYCGVCFLFARLKRLVMEEALFSSMARIEKILYPILILVTVGLAVFAFSKSNAFYGGKNPFDIIYTSDSPMLVYANAYFRLWHGENDLRQPLFAVFAAPFTGAAYFIGRLLPFSSYSWQLWVDISQIILLFFAIYLLTRLLELSLFQRVCFMIFSCCGYTYLLFSIMMEQYIVAYFWLILLLYCLKKKYNSRDTFLIGAGGSLLTSLVTLPFFTSSNPLRSNKKWLKEIVCKGEAFIVCMLIFGRFDILCNLSEKLDFLNSFTGARVLFADKVKQFLSFVANCYFAPNAGINHTFQKYITWQLNPVTGICWAGVLLCLLCFASAIVNRHKKSTQIAAGWALFSVVILLILGWGSQENGMILYSLYFGWAFIVLIFQLAARVDQRIGKPVFVLCLTLFGVGTVLCKNIPAICDLINFAASYYPI